MSDSKKRDLACNVFFILLAIVLFILMPYHVPGKNVADRLGPRFFLNVALWIMLGVNLFCLVTRGCAMLKEKKANAGAGKAEPSAPFGERLAKLYHQEKNVVLIFAIVALASLLMPRFGFIATGIGMNFIILALLGARKWYYYLIAAACLVGIYMLFYHGFHTMLP